MQAGWIFFLFSSPCTEKNIPQQNKQKTKLSKTQFTSGDSIYEQGSYSSSCKYSGNRFLYCFTVLMSITLSGIQALGVVLPCSVLFTHLLPHCSWNAAVRCSHSLHIFCQLSKKDPTSRNFQVKLAWRKKKDKSESLFVTKLC